MQIQLNGNTYRLDRVSTVQDLLDELKLSGKLAVEINQQIVPRSMFMSCQIKSGDTVEIVRAIGGG